MLACHQTTRIYANGVAESLLIQPCLTEEWTGNAPLRRAAKNVVPILYRWLDFEAFDDFGDFVESISCETSESCQVRGSNPCRGGIFWLQQFRRQLPYPCTNSVATSVAELSSALWKLIDVIASST